MSNDEARSYNQLVEDNIRLLAENEELQRSQSNTIERDQFMFNRGVRFGVYGSKNESVTVAMANATEAWHWSK